MTYEYDLFISYSSLDKEWALKLADDLEAKNIKVFIDKERLEIGRPWERQLIKALEASQHFVVLWSGKANSSAWVQKEIANFDNIAHGSEDGTVGRRLIFLNLDEQGTAYSAWQAINSLRDAGAYAAGTNAVDDGLWKGVVAKIADAVRADDDAVPILVAVLTTTSAEAASFSPSVLTVIARDLGIPQDKLLARYGPSRLDWKPFGNQYSIREMINNLVDEINQVVGDIKFRWDPVSEDFWADEKSATQVAVTFAGAKLSLVIVDMVSLKYMDVFQRAMMLQGCLKRDTSVFLVLPPFPTDSTLLTYRELVQGWSAPLFDSYFEPPIPNKERLSPNCGVYCGDVAEIKRLLRSAIGQFALAIQPSSKPVFTALGGKRG